MANKRAHDDAKTSQSRKRRGGGKTSSGDHESPGDASKAEAITARNATKSPLLRLPREIRDIIWENAFGGRTLHHMDDSFSDFVPCHTGRFVFHECLVLEPKQAYKLSRQGASLVDPAQWAATELQHQVPVTDDDEGDIILDHFYCGRDPAAPSFSCITSTACTQVWYESQQSFWKTNTFCFKSIPDLEFFLKATSPTDKLGLIAQISITMDCVDNRNEGSLLFSGALSRLSGLQGVHLTLHCEETAMSVALPPRNATSSSLRLLARLPKLVAQFQQFELHPDKTTVFLEVYEADGRSYGIPSRCPIDIRLKWAEHVREALLTHKPLRRSGRNVKNSNSEA
ncbi:hypothetical protein BDV96DRAFT_639692 [Lophiotrema nucula]|uniref:Uncharacterized protein n=1 Tax=Lophiotrema nucula TaxID=690887 RepID=A0A6A5ZVS4_9PLEO|nr:hypothetical protein BDV96DRAFT_639692 [Lophiotrema nucula]